MFVLDEGPGLCHVQILISCIVQAGIVLFKNEVVKTCPVVYEVEHNKQTQSHTNEQKHYYSILFSGLKKKIAFKKADLKLSKCGLKLRQVWFLFSQFIFLRQGKLVQKMMQIYLVFLQFV